MRSACNEIRFDQFQPVTKKLAWQVVTNAIKDLRIKKLPRDHFIKSTLQNSLWSNYTHSHCVFQKNVPNSLVALFSFVSVFLHRRQQSGQFPSMRILPVSAYKGEILVGFRLSLSQEIKFISVYYSGLVLFSRHHQKC